MSGLTQLLRDPELPVLAKKELPKAAWRDVGLDALRVDPRRGRCCSASSSTSVAKICNSSRRSAVAICSSSQYPQRIRLLASAAARHPDPQRLIRWMMAQEALA